MSLSELRGTAIQHPTLNIPDCIQLIEYREQFQCYSCPLVSYLHPLYTGLYMMLSRETETFQLPPYQHYSRKQLIMFAPRLVFYRRFEVSDGYRSSCPYKRWYIAQSSVCKSQLSFSTQSFCDSERSRTLNISNKIGTWLHQMVRPKSWRFKTTVNCTMLQLQHRAQVGIR